jgi:transmembrane sensor
MNERELKDLIHKFKTGEITEEERAKLESIWTEYSEDESYLNALPESKLARLEIEIFAGVKDKIEANLPGETSEVPKRIFSPSFIYKVAASFVVIVIASALFYNYFVKESLVIYQTKYGQVLKVVLPDRSVVMLNGNSSLKYNKNWNKVGTRQVWLQGEGFFSIVHTENHQKFIVNTSREVDIEVLGTEFNVTDRKDELRVVLSSGKVKLNVDKDKHEEVVMKPGNLVEFKGNDESYTRKDVDPSVYSSWTTDRMVFDNATLAEISNALQETYGLKLEFSDSSLMKETFSASFPKDDIDVLIKAIAKSFNLKILKNGNTVKMISKG